MHNEWLKQNRIRLHLCIECGEPVDQVEDREGKFHKLCAKCREKKAQNKGTLCWKCKHSVPNGIDAGCDWSLDKKPVEGWDAQPTRMKIAEGTYTKSFNVIKCPKFEKDKRQK